MLAKASPQSAALLAAVHAQQEGDDAAAVRSYEFAVRHGELTGVAANNLAWLYARTGQQLDRALALARSARDLAPQSAAVLDTLGMVHLARREYTAGVASLEAARKLTMRQGSPEPKLAQQIAAHLSQAYLLAGQSENATHAVLSR